MEDILKRARKHFRILDYALLNPDLKYSSAQEYIDHFLNIGVYEHRLISRKTLCPNNEFSRELIIVIPYLYYLQQKGLLFNHVITSFRGMYPYYYFLPKNQYRERNQVRPSMFDIPGIYVNYIDDIPIFDTRYWIPPPYQKIYYTPSTFEYSKPLCIIQNKYNSEWMGPPMNFINRETLDKLFSLLENHYQLVYLRPEARFDEKDGFSKDDNKELIFHDDDIVRKHSNVIPWKQLQQKFHWSYNELKLRLFASCTNYISVLGGNNCLNLFFAKKLLILRRRKGDSGLYSGWYRQVNPEMNVELRVSATWEEFLQEAKSMFIDSIDSELPSETLAPNQEVPLPDESA